MKKLIALLLAAIMVLSPCCMCFQPCGGSAGK